MGTHSKDADAWSAASIQSSPESSTAAATKTAESQWCTGPMGRVVLSSFFLETSVEDQPERY